MHRNSQMRKSSQSPLLPLCPFNSVLLHPRHPASHYLSLSKPLPAFIVLPVCQLPSIYYTDKYFPGHKHVVKIFLKLPHVLIDLTLEWVQAVNSRGEM